MDLAQGLSDRAELEVPFGEHRLKVVYNPQKATPKMQHQMVRNPGDEVAGDVEAQALSGLLVEWGLTNAGEKVGTDFETLRDQPMQILDKVLTAIFEDMAASRDSPETTG
jgi:hypothetical protein